MLAKRLDSLSRPKKEAVEIMLERMNAVWLEYDEAFNDEEREEPL